MRNILIIGSLVLALGIIGFLYQQLTSVENALKAANQRFEACQQVTFQLQNQLAEAQKQSGHTPSQQ